MRYIHSFVKSIAGGVKRFFRYTLLAISEFLDDNASHLSASIAYYLLFSVLPVLLAITSLLAYISNAEGLPASVVTFFSEIVPPAYADNVIRVLNDAEIPRSTTGIIGLVGMLWAGTSVFNVIRKTLNIIWGITIPRPFFKERFIEVIMVSVVGAIFLASFYLSIALKLVSVQQEVANFFYSELLPGIIILVIFLFLYRFTPYVKLRWRDVWIESLLAAVAFGITKWIFIEVVFERGEDSALSVWGVGAALLLMLLWTYVSAIIFLFGAEMSSLRYRGVTIWGRGKLETTEGPLPSFLESRIDVSDYVEKDGGDDL
jgi:membrane protein